MSSQLLFKENHLNELIKLIEKEKYQRIFLVRGGDSFYKSGAKEFIDEFLKDKTIVSFSDFDSNPKLEHLQRGVDLFHESNFDLIVAIGGGSVLDMAKMISVFTYQDDDFVSIIKNNSINNNSKTPLLAIPTTSGTGAEATHFAVVYIDKQKFSIASNSILPDYVYLSPIFTYSTNLYLTACAGLDAFGQALESAWSVGANTESEKYAFASIELIWNNLYQAVNTNDQQAKRAMQEASFLAGKAINISKTTAPHALSYTFTSYYNIPHGHAVSLSLPFFINYNFLLSENDCNDSRGADSVKSRINRIFKILDCNINTVEKVLIDFFKSLNIEINIKLLLGSFDKDLIVDNVNIERLNNNPRKVTKDTINSFIKKSQTN